MYTIQVKSTQGEKIKTIGRQGRKRKGAERNPPVEYNQDYLIGVNVNTEVCKWFPKDYYKSRQGKEINLRTMAQYAVIPPIGPKEPDRKFRATLDVLI
jgi:hypothetical protein